MQKWYASTGSNGKTTTTMLIHHILRHAGIDASLAGNIGNSLAWQVARDPHKVYVVELSSFQLDNMYDFKANIAVMLNITPTTSTATTSRCRITSMPNSASFRT